MSNLALAVPFLDRDFQVSEGIAFHGVNNSAALAANNSHVQLFNPVGSSVVVFLDDLTVGGILPLIVRVTQHTTALTFSLTAGLNKNIGGTAPVAELRNQQTSGFLGTEFANIDLGPALRQRAGIIFPVQLDAGQGVVVVPTTQNVGLFVSWEWREKLA